jgi:hypothetical protein
MRAISDNFTEQKLLSHFIQNASQLMWFLGAGTSRTAGMPTATDIVWDLKRKYYCLQENQTIQTHDINNKAVRGKIQSYMDSKGFPSLWTPEEYSFYFDLTFGRDYDSQQKYIKDQMDSKKISLNIGHRVLAAFLEMGITRVVFTTNFDEVMETAFAAVTGKNLTSFHLEGSYAALAALNAEQFPVYAKIHGDFRYKSIKNFASDLLSNDKEIQKCFLASANRYGLVVSGYSGRDSNVMEMFRVALEQGNPFPQGLFWTTPRSSDVAESVRKLINLANEKGVSAYLIETGTFDIMLSKMWRQMPDKPETLDLKVRTVKARTVSIPLPPTGKRYPLLRTNALAITECPRQCARVDYSAPITFQELNEKVREHQPNVVLSYKEQILFWGSPSEICKILEKEKVKEFGDYHFKDPIAAISQSGIIKSFFEEAIAQSLCHGKPLLLRRKGRTHYAVVNQEDVNNPLFQPLKDSLAFRSNLGLITGSVSGLSETFWAEALSIKIEEKNGTLWLLIRPDIWITPLTMRENATDFLRKRKMYRYNNMSYHLLDAWIRVLFGFLGTGQDVRVSCFTDTDYAPTFSVNTSTAFSGSVDAND